MIPYNIGVPPTHEIVATSMYEVSGHKDVHYVICNDVSCEHCLKQDLYRACPVCGKAVIHNDTGTSKCICGSLICTCDGYVTRFVPVYKPLEDMLTDNTGDII